MTTNTLIHRARRFLPLLIMQLSDTLWHVFGVSVLTLLGVMLTLLALKFIEVTNTAGAVLTCCVGSSPFVLITLSLATVRATRDYRERYRGKDESEAS